MFVLYGYHNDIRKWQKKQLWNEDLKESASFYKKAYQATYISSGSIKFVSSCSVAQAFAGVIRSMKSEQAVREAKTW